MRILIVLPCDFLIFNSFLYHIKQIDYNLQWVCAVIRHDDVKMREEHQRHNRLRLVFSPHFNIIRYIFTEWTQQDLYFCNKHIRLTELRNHPRLNMYHSDQN